MIRLARHFVSLTALVVLLVSAAPGASHAGTKTLARPRRTVFFARLALRRVLLRRSHGTAGGAATTARAQDGYALFAPIWNFSIEAGASVIRGVAGALELLPGIALVPFDAEMNALYDLPESQPAWVDQGSESFKVKFGINYLTSTQ